jgi:hypothetical protein
MSAFSDSYVSRVLLATPPQGRGLDVVMRPWRWLRTSLFDPYRPELHYMRGPGPKWRTSAPARGLPGYFRRMAAGRVRRSMCDVT